METIVPLSQLYEEAQIVPISYTSVTHDTMNICVLDKRGIQLINSKQQPYSVIVIEFKRLDKNTDVAYTKKCPIFADQRDLLLSLDVGKVYRITTAPTKYKEWMDATLINLDATNENI